MTSYLQTSEVLRAFTSAHEETSALTEAIFRVEGEMDRRVSRVCMGGYIV